MSIENYGVVLPGTTSEVDKRRFRVIPLTKENMDMAGIGELSVDRTNGDIFVKDSLGNNISRTANIEQTISDYMKNDINNMSFMYNHNRRVYRLFFNSDMVRLDKNLILDDSCAYFRIRDISDNGLYYVPTLTAIHADAVVSLPLKENDLYFVEFYNVSGEEISMIPFSAKSTLYFDNINAHDEIATSIRIYTNKDYMYLDEDISSLLTKVYAVYDDGSEKDITNVSSVDIDFGTLNTTISGVYPIKATWVYDVDNVLSFKAEKNITVKVDPSATIADMIVIPKKIVNLNDGSKAIRLSVIVYYADGSSEDVSYRVIISNFNPELFNVSQTIVIKLNAGTQNVFTQSYEINVKDNGSSSPYTLFFTSDNILTLDDTSRVTYPINAVYYKVRNADDLNTYYTHSYNELHYSSMFTETEDSKLTEGKNVIVEFYDNTYNLIDSDAYSCIYKII